MSAERQLAQEQRTLAGLRERLPPGTAVYTYRVARIDENTCIVAAFVRGSTRGARSGIAERLRPRREWRNICSAVAILGVCPPAREPYDAALVVSNEHYLVKRLEDVIWLDTKLDAPMTRKQRRLLRRAKRHAAVPLTERPARGIGLFTHVRLPSGPTPWRG
jgi:hypothetical protein